MWVRARPEAPGRHSLIGFHSPVEKVYATEGKGVIENFKIRGLGSSTLHLAYAAIEGVNGKDIRQVSSAGRWMAEGAGVGQ